MKLGATEKRYLRGAVIALVLGVALAATSVALAHFYWNTARMDNTRAMGEARDVRQKLAQAKNESTELKEKIARYLELKQRGVLGAERRIDWVEQLGALRRERKLADLSYELSAQHPLDKVVLPGGPDAGGHRLATSTLKLRASLLHEGDLTSLLDTLNATLPAHVLIRQCSLSRNETAARESLALSLVAECTAELVTVKEPA